MKFIILTIALFLSLDASAQTPAASPYPVCDEQTTVIPCQYEANEVYSAFADMLIGNPKGYALLRKKTPAQRQHFTDGLMLESVRVILLKQSRRSATDRHDKVTLTTTRYEAILWDCRGTDACNGNYLFTVDEVTESDGYCYQSKYTNKLEPTNLETFGGDSH